MKAIILAAGEGKRMRPLTLVKPKPMIEVLGKPLLHHIIDSLPPEITELIIVIGYKGDVIKAYFGEQFEGRPVTYIYQEKQLGNAHALALCKHLLKPGERFLFMFADDLHSPDAIKRLLQKDIGMLVQEHSDPTRFGVVETDASGHVISIEEKPKQPKTNLVAVGVYVLDTRIFDYKASQHEGGEYYMTDQVAQLIKDHKFVVEKSEFWHPVGYPHDIDAAEKMLSKEHGVVITNDTLVMLLAGGRGTRMPENEKHLPKVLVEVAGKPILQHQLEYLRKQGFRNIRLALGYKAELVVQWLKDNHEQVDYVIETEPLDTGGAVKNAMKDVQGAFIAYNADNLCDFNLTSMLRHSGNGQYNVIYATKIEQGKDYSTLECDEHKRICRFNGKVSEPVSGFIHTGAHVLRADDLKEFSGKFSIEKEFFPKMAEAGKLVICEHHGNYWFDVGTEERLRIVREYFSNSH